MRQRFPGSGIFSDYAAWLSGTSRHGRNTLPNEDIDFPER
jgi:hypothetical protein